MAGTVESTEMSPSIIKFMWHRLMDRNRNLAAPGEYCGYAHP
jgi:hypothetical protein